MIAAYHERIEHFEKKLNVKEKVEKKNAWKFVFLTPYL